MFHCGYGRFSSMWTSIGWEMEEFWKFTWLVENRESIRKFRPIYRKETYVSFFLSNNYIKPYYDVFLMLVYLHATWSTMPLLWLCVFFANFVEPMNMDFSMVTPINGDAFWTTGTIEPSAPSPAKIASLKSRFSGWFDRLKRMSTGEFIFQLQISAHLVSTYPDFLQTEEIRELVDYVVKITRQNCGQKMKSHCFKLFYIIPLFEQRDEGETIVQCSLQLHHVPPSANWELGC